MNLMGPFQAGASVELTNVRVHLAVSPDTSWCKWPYLHFKMNGNNSSVKIFSGSELEAVQLRR